MRLNPVTSSPFPNDLGRHCHYLFSGFSVFVCKFLLPIDFRQFLTAYIVPMVFGAGHLLPLIRLQIFSNRFINCFVFTPRLDVACSAESGIYAEFWQND